MFTITNFSSHIIRFTRLAKKYYFFPQNITTHNMAPSAILFHDALSIGLID